MKRKLVEPIKESPLEKDTKTKSSSAQQGDTEKQEECPLYGSQDYWDQRYKKNYFSLPNDASEGKEDGGVRVSDEEASPGFSWYFNYQELKPLLLPLVLGSNRNDQDEDEDDNEEWSSEEYEEEDMEGEEEEEEEDIADDVEDVDEEEDDNKDGNSSLGGKVGNAFEHADDSKNENEHTKDDSGKHETLVDTAANTDDAEDIQQSNDEEDSTEYEIDPNRPPRKVLEIGCGDVPLGEELCKDIVKLGKTYDMDARNIVSSIICFDYVQCCIDVLRDKQEKEVNGTTTGTTNNRLQVEYKVHDARSLPYKDQEFHVIIDKGTLDAVLSDKLQGKSNCIKILSEAARILSPDEGYILIVSHLNANEPQGMDWLHEVLVPGLSAGCSTCKWKIEVHSNDDVSSEKDDEDENDEETKTREKTSKLQEASKFGPAVYIIQKRNSLEPQNGNVSHDKDSFHSLVDVQFFGY